VSYNLGRALAPMFGILMLATVGTGFAFAGRQCTWVLRRRRQEASIRRAASALCALSIAMIIFVIAPVTWISVAAALVAGMACLLAGAALKTLLQHHAGDRMGVQASVMAAWAVAWAGSKPIASLADGLLVSPLGVHGTGILLALPALAPAAVLVLWPAFGLEMQGGALGGVTC
jgi:hypothetical protein